MCVSSWNGRDTFTIEAIIFKRHMFFEYHYVKLNDGNDNHQVFTILLYDRLAFYLGKFRLLKMIPVPNLKCD